MVLHIKNMLMNNTFILYSLLYLKLKDLNVTFSYNILKIYMLELFIQLFNFFYKHSNMTICLLNKNIGIQ